MAPNFTKPKMVNVDTGTMAYIMTGGWAAWIACFKGGPLAILFDIQVKTWAVAMGISRATPDRRMSRELIIRKRAPL